jgi:hypothetical protein
MVCLNTHRVTASALEPPTRRYGEAICVSFCWRCLPSVDPRRRVLLRPKQRPNINFASRASITLVGAAVHSIVSRSVKPPRPARRPNASLTHGTEPATRRRQFPVGPSPPQLSRYNPITGRAGVTGAAALIANAIPSNARLHSADVVIHDEQNCEG